MAQRSIAATKKTLTTDYTDATDETIELLMLEIKQLNQLIEDISSAQVPAIADPAPQTVDLVKMVTDAWDIAIFKQTKN